VTERSGKPIVCALTAGQRHESPQAIPLLERALHRLWPDAVAGDTGDRSTDVRNWLAEREIEAVIPKRKDETGPNTYDRELYRERGVIEQTINRLKRFRRVATRYEKRAATYLAMITIAMILEWLSLCKQALVPVEWKQASSS
jgi:transposase